ncbi:MAG TPA: metal ABC transporter substrate-binding protein [Candidatus Limnocylindria bacterium]|nr:metal ABC transporter substrate-binding protein [Candidatus Limnocylindria bacterium]
MTTSPTIRLLALLAGLALVLACAGPSGSPPPTDIAASSTTLPASPTDVPANPTASPASPTAGPTGGLSVVTSTTVLADLVRQVGGDRVSVESLMPAGRDPHTFEPSPGDAARLAGADLLVMNGLGLDEWLEDLALDAADGVPLVAVAEDLPGAEYLEGGEHAHGDEDDEDHHDEGDEDHGDEDHGDEDHGDEDDHDHAVNPHLWLDVANARLYVERLAEVLTANDEAGRAAYEANAATYDATLAELDGWIREQIDSTPAENRRVVSFHDAFPYLAHAYGLEIVGVVVESPGQEPSAAEVARLITAIREAGVRAVLTEVQFDDRLAQVIADEAGVSVVDQLFTDSLGEPPLDTYEAAMRWNVERIVAGLR